MAYRDGFERCPRCHVELADARSARGCRECGGLWLDEPTLAEMVQTMVPAEPLAPLVLAVLERAEPPLACPACGTAMRAVTFCGVPIDRCDAHGIWFDARELETALHRVAEGYAEPAPAHSHVERAAEERLAPEPAPLVVVAVTSRAGMRDERSLSGPILKIGSTASAHLRIADDPKVARMHAVIEVDRGTAHLIDLGSRAGTYVNGAPVHKAKLRLGDRITVGDTVIQLVGVRA